MREGIGMTLQQLRYFCVMTEVLHYTKAANQLYISQPSLSYALNELEKELGVPLFEKRGRQTHLTKYGEAFLPYAKNALAELSRGEAKLLEMSDPTGGSVNLGYIYSVGIKTMPKIVEKFYLHQGNRQISFHFQQSMASVLTDKLLDGSLDFVLSVQPDIEQIAYAPITRQELFWVVYEGHPLYERQTVTLHDIAHEKMISINHNTAIYKQLEACFKEASLTPHILFEVDECNSIAAFVASKIGTAILPRIPMVDNYSVRMIPFAEPGLTREISLLWHKNRYMMPSCKCFLDFILRTYPLE